MGRSLQLGRGLLERCVARRAPLEAVSPHEATQPTIPGPARLRAFTLLELLVVVVIIGLLASYVGPRYFGQLGKSEVTTAKAQMQAFGRALDHFRLDVGRYPTTEQGLNALIQRPGDEPKWNGPYLQNKVPLDPWGKAYVYRSPGERSDYDILSYGKDGVPGGAGDNADISLF